MRLPHTLLTVLFSLFFYASFAQIDIPPVMKVMGTEVQITLEGREVILAKYRSLTQNPHLYRRWLDMCHQYFPVVERELAAVGVPDDFKYLMVQESAFRGNAVSSSNAVGFWQFKEATARECQLVINDFVDERKNIVASTRGAASYLKKYNRYLNNWMLALMSFHDGPGAIRRRFGNSQYVRFNFLVVDGSHHYPAHYLAHYFAFKERYEREKVLKESDTYLLEYGVGLINTLYDVAYFLLDDDVRTQQRVEEKMLEINYYNPWIKDGRIPGWKPNYQNAGNYCYSMVIPIEPSARTAYIDRLKPFACDGKVRGQATYYYHDSIPHLYPFVIGTAEWVSNDPSFRYVLANGVKAVEVTRPTNTQKLAKKLALQEQALLQWNDLETLKAPLALGSLIYLESRPDTAPVPYHISQDGETLRAIAHKYGIDMEKLAAWSGVTPDYQVKQGDYLWFNPRD